MQAILSLRAHNVKKMYTMYDLIFSSKDSNIIFKAALSAVWSKTRTVQGTHV